MTRRHLLPVRALLASLLVVVLIVPPQLSTALADASAASPASDGVRLKDGREYKGQIAERVPGSHIVFLTVTGEVKRFDEATVAYAGPLDPTTHALPPPPPKPGEMMEAPKAALAPAPGELMTAEGTRETGALADKTQTPSGQVPVTLEANHPGVLWHAKPTGSPERWLCTSPCTTNLAPGTYHFGLSVGTRGTVWEKESVALDHNQAQLLGSYESHRGKRIAGGVVIGLGIPAALALIIGGARSNKAAEESCSAGGVEDACDDAGVSDGGKLSIGLGVVTGIASLVIGALLTTARDKAKVRTR